MVRLALPRSILARLIMSPTSPFLSALLHPTHTNCVPNLATRFALVFRHVLPTYASLHCIPPLIFKRDLLFNRRSPPRSAAEEGKVEEIEGGLASAQEGAEVVVKTEGQGVVRLVAEHGEVKKRPLKGRVNWKEVWKMLWRSVRGTVRSGSFLSMFVVIYHGKSNHLGSYQLFSDALWITGVICAQQNIHPLLPRRLARATTQTHWFAGLLTSLALFIEEKVRLCQLRHAFTS